MVSSTKTYLKRKKKYEETFEDKTTDYFPEEIRANAMNKMVVQ